MALDLDGRREGSSGHGSRVGALSGTFKALLSTTTASAASRFNANGAPWVRVDGIPIAAPGTSPFTEIEAPINVWPDGAYAGGNLVATGALAPDATTVATRNCNDWTEGAAGEALNGWSQETVTWFSDFGPQTFPCNTDWSLYCLQE